MSHDRFDGLDDWRRDVDEKLDAMLDGIAEVVSGLTHLRHITLTQGERLMTQANDNTSKLLDAFDTETNRIAAKWDAEVAALNAASASGGLSADETTALAARLSVDVDRLKTIAADPANPVPPVPPVTP